MPDDSKANPTPVSDRQEGLMKVAEGLREIRDIATARGLGEVVRRVDTALEICEAKQKLARLEHLHTEFEHKASEQNLD